MTALLREGLRELGLDESRVETLERFAALLLKKNEVMNLTAITEPEAVAQLHLLDSAALTRFVDLSGKTVVDVGTGAGFPGMPLRILKDDFDLTLLDSLGKRIAWLEEVCGTLGLKRVECVHARAEEFAAGPCGVARRRTAQCALRAGAAACEGRRAIPRDEERRHRGGDRRGKGRDQNARRKNRQGRGLHHPDERGHAPRGGDREGLPYPAEVSEGVRKDQKAAAVSG